MAAVVLISFAALPLNASGSERITDVTRHALWPRRPLPVVEAPPARCGIPGARVASSGAMDDKRFALDEATRQDAVWRYYSSPVVLQAGQVALQEQTVAFEAPAGALGIAGFLVSVQEDVGGEWVELRPNTDTYLHHFTIATNFDSPGKDFANVPLAGGRTYRLPCSNNPRFEAGNGGLGAVSYDFGKHYMSDAGHRLPRWPAGKLSMWRLGFHLLNLRDVTLPFEDAAQCRCEGIRGPTPYWQDANSTPTPETPNQLATRAAPTHLPPVAMHRDPSAGGGPAINGSIVCCTHLCRFNTSRTPTGAERPPRTFRFHVRLRWAVPDAVRAALGHEGTHHGLEPHEGSSTQHRTQRPPTGRSEQGRSDEGTHVHGTHGREASEGLLGRGYPSGALGRPLGAMLLPGFDYTESFSNQNGTAVRNARPPLSAAQQPCSLEFNFDQCSADGRVTCTPRIIGTEVKRHAQSARPRLGRTRASPVRARALPHTPSPKPQAPHRTPTAPRYPAPQP